MVNVKSPTITMKMRSLKVTLKITKGMESAFYREGHSILKQGIREAARMDPIKRESVLTTSKKESTAMTNCMVGLRSKRESSTPSTAMKRELR
jgi:hypothetical protein